MAERLRKAVDERFYLSRASGGGTLRREIWVDRDGRAVRYSLVYIKHLIYGGDNGRVLGYDSAHGSHHRHFMGKVAEVSFESFEAVEARFQKEWKSLAREVRRAKD